MGMLSAIFATVLIAHAVGTLFTIPALVGVKFGKIQISKATTMRRLMQSMPLVALNFAISVIVGGIGAVFNSREHVLVDITEDLPSSQTLVWQSAVFFLATETVFYYVHRSFHQSKFLYAMIH